MIVFITTRGHGYTVDPLHDGSFDFDVPKVRTATYEALFRARKVPSATYIFSDIERLTPAELHLAADLYRGFGEAGLTRLNDPAKVMSRFELLRALHRSGINPFNVHRADDDPRPARFPVILRRGFDHRLPELAL